MSCFTWVRRINDYAFHFIDINIFTNTHERMIAISVWGIMATVGAAIGPVLGEYWLSF